MFDIGRLIFQKKIVLIDNFIYTYSWEVEHIYLKLCNCNIVKEIKL